jgi:hypothetical protein
MFHQSPHLLVEVGLRAQNTTWNFRMPCGIISNTFKVKIFIFFVTFLSQHLNSIVIITWKILNYIGIKKLIHFIILGTRPTSILGPKRDQLVLLLLRQNNLAIMKMLDFILVDLPIFFPIKMNCEWSIHVCCC